MVAQLFPTEHLNLVEDSMRLVSVDALGDLIGAMGRCNETCKW